MLHGYEPIEMAVSKKRFITCHNFEHTFVMYWHILTHSRYRLTPRKTPCSLASHFTGAVGIKCVLGSIGCPVTQGWFKHSSNDSLPGSQCCVWLAGFCWMLWVSLGESSPSGILNSLNRGWTHISHMKIQPFSMAETDSSKSCQGRCKRICSYWTDHLIWYRRTNCASLWHSLSLSPCFAALFMSI